MSFYSERGHDFSKGWRLHPKVAAIFIELSAAPIEVKEST